MDIRGNPISCDCTVYALLRYMNGELNDILKIKTTNLVCHSPKEYRGISLSNINIDEFTCDFYVPNIPNNLCKMNCPMKLNWAKKLITFNCEKMSFTQLPQDLCLIPGYEIELNLRNNLLEEMPIIDISDYKAVVKLNLSGNKINRFDRRIMFSNIEVNMTL